MSPNDSASGWVDPNPPETTDPRAERKLIAAGVVLTTIVLLVFTGVVLAKNAGLFGGGDAGRRSVVLIAANVAGDDPFTPSVVVSPVEIADAVTADITAFTKQLPRSAERGVRLVPGNQPGLYGGTGEALECDVPAVANHLDAHSDRSKPWAQAIGIAPQKIPYYLNTLTPVVLIADTWVTAFTFTEARAVPGQAVLQAGNAVLIDQTGVPRLHCATGDPLAPPANADFAAFGVTGKPWPDFDQQDVVAVAYSVGRPIQPVVTVFELRDVGTGEPISRPAGKTIDIGMDPSGWSPDPQAMNVPPTQGTS